MNDQRAFSVGKGGGGQGILRAIHIPRVVGGWLLESGFVLENGTRMGRKQHMDQCARMLDACPLARGSISGHTAIC